MRRWLVLPLVSVAGCGGGESDYPVVPAQVLALERAAGSTVPEERITTRIEVPADTREWAVTAPRSWPVVEDGGARRLVLDGGEEHRLEIPGKYESRTWNLLVVDVLARRDLILRAALSRVADDPGGELATVGSPSVVRLHSGQRLRAEFDLRALANLDEAFDRLVIVGSGKRRIHWELLGLELVSRPTERWLRLAEDGPGRVVIRGEARRAVGLATGTTLSAELLVPVGGELALGLAPAPRAECAQDATLRVGASGGAGEEELLARVEIDGTSWADARVPLGSLAGRRVRLSFRLEDAGSGGMIAIEPPVAFVPRRAPTVLLITSDTHRGDHLGASSRDVGVHTPTLDRLAADGVLFEDCLASSCVTLPSHAALMTGTNPRDTGVVDNGTALGGDARTLAECFHDAGWTTFAATSTRLLQPDWSGLGQGFDRFAWPKSDGSCAGDETLERLQSWLPSARGRPLFAWLHLYDAHRPYDPPEEYVARHYDEDGDPFDKSIEADFHPLPEAPKVRDVAWVHALYRGEVSWVDHVVGRLLGNDRFDDAVMAFTSDHGECLGEQGVWWTHLGAYPAALHVPLVLRWPGAPAGRVVTEGVRQIDVSRTLLGLAGIEASDYPGTDLRRWLEARPPDDSRRFAVADRGQAVALSQGRWHFVVNLTGYLGKTRVMATRDPLEHPVELFDTSSDPGCQHDLVEDQPERAAALAAALLDWATSAPLRRAEAHLPTAESRRMLDELGYGGAEESPGDDWGAESVLDLDILRERLAPYLR